MPGRHLGSSNLSSLKDLVAQEEQIHVVLATIVIEPGEESQWFETNEGQVCVTCRTNRHNAPITALLPSGGGIANGFWSMPDPGTVVAIGFDFGDYEGDAFVLAMYGNTKPAQLDTDYNVIVADRTDVVSQGKNNAESLALLRDINNALIFLRQQFDTSHGHTHAVSGGATTTVIAGDGDGTGTGFSIPVGIGCNVLQVEGADR